MGGYGDRAFPSENQICVYADPMDVSGQCVVCGAWLMRDIGVQMQLKAGTSPRIVRPDACPVGCSTARASGMVESLRIGGGLQVPVVAVSAVDDGW